jgi:hypothetical protein
VRFDTATQKVDVISDWIDGFGALPSDDDRRYFNNSDALIDGDEIFMPFYSKDAIFGLNAKTLEWRIIDLNPEKKNGKSAVKTGAVYGYVTSKVYENTHYMLSKTYDRLVAWTPKNGVLATYQVPDVQVDAGVDDEYSECVIERNEAIYFFPIITKHIIKFDTQSGKVTLADHESVNMCYNLSENISSHSYRFSQPLELGDKTLLQCSRAAELLEWDKKTGEVKRIPPLLLCDKDAEIVNDCVSNYIKGINLRKDVFPAEISTAALSIFLEFVKSRDTEAPETAKSDDSQYSSAGQRIYDYVKKLILEKNEAIGIKLS